VLLREDDLDMVFREAIGEAGVDLALLLCSVPPLSEASETTERDLTGLDRVADSDGIEGPRRRAYESDTLSQKK